MRVTPRLPLSLVAAAVLVLNLADALFTLAYVHAGIAEEANPLMAGPLGVGPVAFVSVKLALVSLGVLLLVRLHRHRAAAVALVGSAVAYASLLAYHLTGVPHLVAVAGS